ncbi:MAG TPA: DUF1003 domain-containing protein [Isosphaeraceae bacterium]|nr:DUF1003 domain-containing protein [Isosphaeraceae bacterium]
MTTTISKLDATDTCQVCGRVLPLAELLPGRLVRPPVERTIRDAFGAWNPARPICLIDLNRFRAEHVEKMLEEERGRLSALESEVVRSLEEQDTIARNVDAAFERQLTLAERVADRMAEFGGSWTFILIFVGVIVSWVVLNSIRLWQEPFDPFPYILLNLVLSCLAAIQAPVIMMSQNRQEAKDRLRGESDYRTNLKAELEIRNLNSKIDMLLTHQWQQLLEIQKIQMEMMQELLKHEGRAGGDRPARA